jgi:capsular polysaccharide biosynthesis protein
MTERDFLVAAWRQRLLVLGIFLLIVGATAVLSKSLPKVYSSTSTLISLAGDEQTFDSVQAGQSLARSYADIMESPLIARLVAQRLGRPQDVEEIARSASFEPLTETQLLKVTAEDRDPETARRVADTYSTVFIDYSGRRLSRATGSRIALAVPAQRSNQAVRPRPTLNVVLAMILGFAACSRRRVPARPRRSADSNEGGRRGPLRPPRSGRDSRARS